MSSNDNTDNVGTNSVSRRSALASIGAAVTLPFSTKVVAGSDTTRIRYVVTDDEVLKWKEVPQSWLEHVRHVRKLKADFEDDIGPMSGVESTALTKSSKEYGGKPGLKITAYGGPKKQTVVPDEYQGVDVEFAPTREWKDACHYDTYDDVEGGVPVEARWDENGTSYTGWGTAALPVNDENGNERLLTANHLWENQKCGSATGEEATQYTQDFGEVAVSEPGADFALVEKTNSSLEMSTGIQEEFGSQNISGYYPEDGLSDLVSEGKDVHKMGVTTGKTTGTIKAMNERIGFDCNDLEGHGVVVDGLNVGEGDSGGPMYRIEEIGGFKWAVLVGHTSQFRQVDDNKSCVGESRDIGNTAGGHAWYHKNEEYGITFL
jgi:hypothetical protein